MDKTKAIIHSTAWQECARALRKNIHQPPSQARLPFYVEGEQVGSAEVHVASLLVKNKLLEQTGNIVHLKCDAFTNAQLAKVAQCLHDSKLSGVWRDEQLDVTTQTGQVLAKIERAAVRPLGISTTAVYLIGVSVEGGYWLQRRSLHKATDAGKLDALVGGLVTAGEGMMQALIREAKEEAGLELSANTSFKHTGSFSTQRPIDPEIGGYMVEYGHWHLMELPANVGLSNEDGEVCGFEYFSAHDLMDAIMAGEVSQECAYIFSAVFALPS